MTQRAEGALMAREEGPRRSGDRGGRRADPRVTGSFLRKKACRPLDRSLPRSKLRRAFLRSRSFAGSEGTGAPATAFRPVARTSRAFLARTSRAFLAPTPPAPDPGSSGVAGRAPA